MEVMIVWRVQLIDATHTSNRHGVGPHGLSPPPLFYARRFIGYSGSGRGIFISNVARMKRSEIKATKLQPVRVQFTHLQCPHNSLVVFLDQIIVREALFCLHIDRIADLDSAGSTG